MRATVQTQWFNLPKFDQLAENKAISAKKLSYF